MPPHACPPLTSSASPPLRTLLGSHIRTLAYTALLAAAGVLARAQQPAFRHLTVAEGAPDNSLVCAAFDRSGVLWLGSRSGLASFDGVAVQRYTTRTHPGLPSDAVIKCLVDAHNHVWLGTDQGLAVLDHWRRMQRVQLPPALHGQPVQQLIAAGDGGILARIGPRGHALWQLLSFSTLHWQPQPWLDSVTSRLDHVESFDGYRYLLCSRTQLRLVDVVRRRIVLNVPLKHTACCRGWDDGIFSTLADTPVLCQTPVMKSGAPQSFQSMADDAGHLSGTVQWMAAAPDSTLFFASRARGVYRFSPSTGRLLHFTHDAYNRQSLPDDRNVGMKMGADGTLVVLTASGAAYTDLRNAALEYQPYSLTIDGTRVEEPVRGTAEDSTGALWISTATHLLRRDTRGITTSILHKPGDNRSDNFYAPAVADDRNVWVPVRGEGIAVFGVDGGLRNWLRKPSLPTARIRLLRNIGGGWLAAGTEASGVFRIRTSDGLVDTFFAHPLLRRIQPKRVIDILPEGDSVWWIATSTRGAAWRYDFKNRTLVKLGTPNGLLSERVYALARDGAGALYVGTFGGLTVYGRDGRIHQHHIATGLLHNRVDALVTDARGRVWASNNRVLLCFAPGGETWRRMDEQAGLPGAAFAIAQPCIRRDGSIVFATDHGMLTVPPDAQSRESLAQPVLHLFREHGGAEVPIGASERISLPHRAANLTFHYRVARITSAPRALFRYRMDGLDAGWSATTEARSVTYNLKPGDYRFRVEASADGRTWSAASSPVIHVPKPWWARTQAIIAWIILGAVSVYTAIRARVAAVQRHARMRQALAEAREASLQQQLELQQVISYFATTIGAKTSVDDILWDVTRHCIARLGFEDCVIYLLDHADGMLHQRAAWGPKTTEDARIVNPLAIRVGEGITGAVAASGKSLLVPDTANDVRYIVDDARRGSELAVPMLASSGAVMGVIDSEHPRTHFYTEQHVLILSTIAALCADKIEKLEAEQRVRAKEVEVLTIGKDLAHSQLTALRSQMNPHFLFNSLNAIQECVVTGEMDAAYDYLSRFSRLLRLVLRHSEHDFISLGEEVEVTELYLSLEALRLRHQFSYDIVVDSSLDVDDVRVPSLLLQPFVENAVWHGLMHKDGDKTLRIAFHEEDEALVCVVEDNGVGRAEAARIRAKRLAGVGQESVGTRLSRQKLELLQSRYGIAAQLIVEDLCSADGSPAGTRVTVTIPATT